MKTETCTVSVIMPAFNAEQFIAQAIESVLRQDVSLELIIVDDASTDKTEKISQQYTADARVTYIRNAVNQGVAESRNIAVRNARGIYVAFLDADDWWQEGKLKKQIELIEKKAAVLCYTGRGLYSNSGEALKKEIHVKESLTYQQLLHNNAIACSSVLMRREAAIAIPMSHDEYHEDYMVWLKCLEQYGTAYGIDEPLLCYRMSNNGKSRNHLKSIRMTYGMHRHMGKSVIKALYYTGCHLVNAVRKYW